MINTPFAIMHKKHDALDRLRLQFNWGNYRFHVLRCHLVVFPAGKIIEEHQHSEYEFHYIVSGKGQVIIEGYPFRLQGGMFYLTGPGIVHRQEVDESEEMEELCLHIDILPHDSPSDDDWEGSLEASEAAYCMDQIHRLPQHPIADKHDAMQWFLHAYRAWYDNHPGLYSTLKMSIIQILWQSVRALEPSESRHSLPERDMNTYRYELATQFMRDNFSSKLTLEAVAERLFISSRQLQRIFRHCSGSGFSEMLERIRIEHVCRKLAHSVETIEEIAETSGFTSASYLYTVFKKHTGLTPRQYKEDQNRKEG